MSTDPPPDLSDPAPPIVLSPLERFEGSLANRVYLSLKEAILSLALQPGQILRKGVICEQMGISRSPVAEAVTRLAAEGLVDVVPQAGTFVARFSWEEIREGAFLREALELAAVEQVAEAITDDQLRLLRRNLTIQQALVADGDIDGFYRMDSEMHELILSFTGFRRVGQLAESSWLQVNRARRMVPPNPGRLRDTLAEHSRIIEALADRNPTAARAATRDHLRQLVRILQPLEQAHPEIFQIQ